MCEADFKAGFTCWRSNILLRIQWRLDPYTFGCCGGAGGKCLCTIVIERFWLQKMVQGTDLQGTTSLGKTIVKCTSKTRLQIQTQPVQQSVLVSHTHKKKSGTRIMSTNCLLRCFQISHWSRLTSWQALAPEIIGRFDSNMGKALLCWHHWPHLCLQMSASGSSWQQNGCTCTFTPCILLDVAECCWMLLGVAGCCWMLLSVVGCCWMLLVVAGCRWILLLDLLSVVGCCWVLPDAT